MSAIAPLQPLWEIEDELAALLESVATCDEDLQPELQARIAEYSAQSAAKVDNIAHVLAALEYEQKAAGDEIARLQERKKAAAKAQDRLEQYVCRVIQARGVKKLEGRTNSLAVRPSDAVVITDAIAVPTRYINTTVTMPLAIWLEHGGVFQGLSVSGTNAADKAAIKKALKAGEEISGADLEYRQNLVRR